MSNQSKANLPTKVSEMDQRIDACGARITSEDILAIIEQVYHFDLATIPLQDNPLTPEEVIHTFLQNGSKPVHGAQIRELINDHFSVNLDALSMLDGAKISIYSKGQWMLRNEEDYFVVHTGVGDVDVTITHTPYFTEQTGLSILPDGLKLALRELGYQPDAETGGYTYVSPTGVAVSDDFKGKTISAILQVLAQY